MHARNDSGRSTPGMMHIPFLEIPDVDQAKPDYVLIRSWNLKEETMSQMNLVAAWGRRLIISMPGVTDIDPEDLPR
jgi:hypothetical protein